MSVADIEHSSVMSAAAMAMIGPMGRWEPNARGRLERAALELYAEHGFEQTTVAEIAGRAGLTERTFFRHFADKREVLFAGSAVLRDHIVNAVAIAPASASPIEAIAAGLDAAAGVFPLERREHARRRAAVIAANAELRERELTKMASYSAALVERSEEHTSELQSQSNLVCRLLLEKKKN